MGREIMKRKDEIIAAFEELDKRCRFIFRGDCGFSFLSGAEWADKQKKPIRNVDEIIQAAGEFVWEHDFLTESTCKRAFIAGAEWANEHTRK